LRVVNDKQLTARRQKRRRGGEETSFLSLTSKSSNSGFHVSSSSLNFNLYAAVSSFIKVKKKIKKWGVRKQRLN
jgi:hypothetical protein